MNRITSDDDIEAFLDDAESSLVTVLRNAEVGQKPTVDEMMQGPPDKGPEDDDSKDE